MNTTTTNQSLDESTLTADHEFDIHEHLARKHTIADLWSAEDVQSNCDELTEEQAWEVLQEVQRRYDPSDGINWTVIEDVAASLFPQPDFTEDELGSTQDSNSRERTLTMKLHIEQIQHHRNGISGAPFHVLIFRDPEVGRMLGIVFEQKYHVAAFNLDKLFVGDIAFGSNSWRGDQYEPHLRRAIEQTTQEVQP